MPIKDGYQASIEIRELFHSLNLPQPIITAVTGHTEQTYVDRAFDSGMNQVFNKPVDVDLLKYTIQKIGIA